jgi:hypothetical protein
MSVDCVLPDYRFEFGLFTQWFEVALDGGAGSELGIQPNGNPVRAPAWD